MAYGGQAGLLDVEKELTCSICTEILFQPLTLLDCLHTFCGSCLKEWFSWQASQASAAKPSPYTCPSCRASVRETRPNATVTTLLDMYLQANPRRGRTQEEKDELKQRFKPGDRVLPRVTIYSNDSDDERMLAEVREISLREVGVPESGSYERGTRHRTTQRQRDPRDNGQRRSQQQSGAAQHALAEAGSHRQVGHQSSLRSLMSSSEIDSSEMEEAILRLVDEGWLDGIDLNNLDTSQVDELSERIADAYRRRHRHGSRPRDARTEDPRRSRGDSRRRSQESSHNRNSRSSTATEQPHHSSHPPVSRPHLLQAYPTPQSHQRRASSEQRRQSSPSPRSSAGRINSGNQHQASRSATDLSDRPSRSAPRSRPVEMASQNRRPTDQDSRHGNGSRGNDGPDSTSNRPESGGDHNAPISTSRETQPRPALPPRSSDSAHIHTAGPANESGLQPNPRHRPDPLPSSDTIQPLITSTSVVAPVLYTEPLIGCNRCERPNIQYELHWNCSRCHSGRYNLCLQCYRLGRGCLHWYGFGFAALQRYQREAKNYSKLQDLPRPHALIGHQYRRPRPETNALPPSENGQVLTTQDPALRLQFGAFCASCLSNANACFWKCSSCNDGEWGYCNRCVNQGRCCTHPLLPVAHKSSLDPATAHDIRLGAHTSCVPDLGRRSPSSSQFIGLSPPNHYIPLTLSTKCHSCEYPIPPSNTRFHCFQCNDGDYNICTTSYLQLISTRRISTDNGDKGWRRCPNGHRMIVVGFEDSTAGQRRVVVRDLVGGHGLKDDGNNGLQNTSQQELSWQDGDQRQVRTVSRHVAFDEPQEAAATANTLLPNHTPSGGFGMRALAMWGYWPEDEGQDDLLFPRGAEIREVENINGDWLLGYYAGKLGLFPGKYVRVLDDVRS